MESNQQTPPNLVHPTHSSDAKYVSRLSTIMVATIQEAKERISQGFATFQEANDRISQVEYIFCSQLFPNMQMKVESLQNIYSEAREDAELAYKEKEKELLLRITELRSEKQHLLEENQFLKLDKAKFFKMESKCDRLNELQEELKQKNSEVNNTREELQDLQKLLESKESVVHRYESTIKELEEKAIMLQDKLKSLEVENEELRVNVMKKSGDVDGLQNKLIHANQPMASLIVKKDEQLKKHEEKENAQNFKLQILEKKVDELQSALSVKCEEVDKGKELQGNLLKKIEFQAAEVVHNEQLLNKLDTENKLLTDRIKKVISGVDELQKELRNKNSELDERRKVHQQLLKQIDSLNLEIMTTRQELDENLQEKKLLLDKQRDLEEKFDKLQQSLDEISKESSERKELNTNLLLQIEVKNTEVESAKSKVSKAFDSFKKVKSQYLHMCKKYGHIPETPTTHKQIDDESEKIRDDGHPVTFKDINTKASKPALQDNKEVASRPGPVSPHPSSTFIAPKCPSSRKSTSGTKRAISYWRDTRSHQSRVGNDLHDDFLDTPLENARGNSGKVLKKQSREVPELGLDDMNFDNSDDETQDMNVDPRQGMEQLPASKPGTSSGFKYVEPVRKKAERENLKGIECKQCKKFYDAVLPEAGEKSSPNIRCEHHDGVSRHRYRYAPPLTPEGFWNIGFETEM